MSDLLETGSNWLQAQRTKHATRTVLYRQGAGSVAVAVTVGRTVYEQDDGAGVLTRTEVRDYLINVAELVIDDESVTPRRGDRIEETVDGTTFIYEVMSLGKDSHWRYSDPYRTTYRIHTKQTGKVEN